MHKFFVVGKLFFVLLFFIPRTVYSNGGTLGDQVYDNLEDEESDSNNKINQKTPTPQSSSNKKSSKQPSSNPMVTKKKPKDSKNLTAPIPSLDSPVATQEPKETIETAGVPLAPKDPEKSMSMAVKTIKKNSSFNPFTQIFANKPQVLSTEHIQLKAKMKETFRPHEIQIPDYKSPFLYGDLSNRRTPFFFFLFFKNYSSIFRFFFRLFYLFAYIVNVWNSHDEESKNHSNPDHSHDKEHDSRLKSLISFNISFIVVTLLYYIIYYLYINNFHQKRNEDNAYYLTNKSIYWRHNQLYKSYNPLLISFYKYGDFVINGLFFFIILIFQYLFTKHNKSHGDSDDKGEEEVYKYLTLFAFFYFFLIECLFSRFLFFLLNGGIIEFNNYLMEETYVKPDKNTLLVRYYTPSDDSNYNTQWADTTQSILNELKNTNLEEERQQIISENLDDDCVYNGQSWVFVWKKS